MLISLESTIIESGLRLVVVTPLRTKDVEAKEEQLGLFCTEIDGFWLNDIRIVGGNEQACKLFQFTDKSSVAKA